MMNELSPEAKQALINVGTNRQGAKGVSVAGIAVTTELFLAGLVGKGAGLTRKGTIVRQRLVEAAMDSAFS